MNAQYIKLTLTQINRDQYESVVDLLFRWGAQGVSENLEFNQQDLQYDPEILESDRIDLEAFFLIHDLESLKQNLSSQQDLNFFISIEQSKDWLSEWKKHYKPFQVIENLWVYPCWEKEKIQQDQEAIIIDPGLAFGTGTHATTDLCLRALYKNLKSKNFSSALDMGAGTGILSILMHKKKVSKIIACEIDELARQNCQQNLILNKAQSIQVLDPKELKSDDKFELVVANIVDGVLLKLKDQLTNWCTKKLILSGILTENVEDLKKAFESLQFELVNSTGKEEWVCLEFVRKDKPF